MSRRVAVPDRVLTMGVVDRVEYGDAFVVDLPPGAAERSLDEWAELVIGDAPRWFRELIRVVHRGVLGLRLVPRAESAPVPGWRRIPGDGREFVYGVAGGLITPQIVIMSAPDRILVSTVVRYDRPAARVVWPVVAPLHRTVARVLLWRAGRRIAPRAVRS